MIKLTAAGGAGLLASQVSANAFLGESAVLRKPLALSNDEWFAQRAWSVSANKVDCRNKPCTRHLSPAIR